MYLVGGAVRDFLIAQSARAHPDGESGPHKLDAGLLGEFLDKHRLEPPGADGMENAPAENDFVVCGIPLDELAARLGRLGKCDFVGKSFGVLKFAPHSDCEFLGWRLRGGARYDVALPRVEKSTGARHRDFEVAYDPFIPIERDLMRRDFTINAMAATPGGVLIDPASGRADLRRKILRTVFENSFAEDPLRVLRAAQFAARFSLTLDAGLIESAKATPLADVSPERVRWELVKGLTLSETPSQFFAHLAAMEKLADAFPEVSAIEDFEDFGRLLDNCRPGLRLDVLFCIAGERGKKLFERLKFSNLEIRRASALSGLAAEFASIAAENMPKSKMRSALKKAAKTPGIKDAAEGTLTFLEFARAIFGDRFGELEVRMRAEIPAVMAYLESPPLTGERLLQMGYPQGRRIGEILQAVSAAHDRGEVETAADAEAWVMEKYAGKG